VEVTLQESPFCPFCEKLRPILERICEALNIPFFRRQVSLDPHIWGGDAAHETFKKEFLEQHAPDLAEDPFASALSEYLSKRIHTPVVVISADLPSGPLEIVIRGFTTKYGQETVAFERHLFMLLSSLKEAEKRTKRFVHTIETALRR